MADDVSRGVGKCENNDPGSYGYPTRPEEPYAFCPKCGGPMVWVCPNCEAPLPDDPAELGEARFCRHCGTAYFSGENDADAPPEGTQTAST